MIIEPPLSFIHRIVAPNVSGIACFSCFFTRWRKILWRGHLPPDLGEGDPWQKGRCFIQQARGRGCDKRGSVIMIAIVHSSIRDPLSNTIPSASRAVHTHWSVPVTGSAPVTRAAVGLWWWLSGGRAGRSGEVSKSYQLCEHKPLTPHTHLVCDNELHSAMLQGQVHWELNRKDQVHQADIG